MITSALLSRVVVAATMVATVAVGAPDHSGAIDRPVVFCDVSTDAFHAEAVAWARSAGVVAGTNDIRFAPDSPTTRGQIIALLFRFVAWENGGVEPPADGPHPFSDVPAGAFYERPVRWAVAAGVSSGATATSFDPEGPTTREQLAALVHRLRAAPPGWPVTDHS